MTFQSPLTDPLQLTLGSCQLLQGSLYVACLFACLHGLQGACVAAIECFRAFLHWGTVGCVTTDMV